MNRDGASCTPPAPPNRPGTMGHRKDTVAPCPQRRPGGDGCHSKPESVAEPQGLGPDQDAVTPPLRLGRKEGAQTVKRLTPPTQALAALPPRATRHTTQPPMSTAHTCALIVEPDAQLPRRARGRPATDARAHSTLLGGTLHTTEPRDHLADMQRAARHTQPQTLVTRETLAIHPPPCDTLSTWWQLSQEHGHWKLVARAQCLAYCKAWGTDIALSLRSCPGTQGTNRTSEHQWENGGGGAQSWKASGRRAALNKYKGGGRGSPVGPGPLHKYIEAHIPQRCRNPQETCCKDPGEPRDTHYRRPPPPGRRMRPQAHHAWTFYDGRPCRDRSTPRRSQTRNAQTHTQQQVTVPLGRQTPGTCPHTWARDL